MRIVLAQKSFLPTLLTLVNFIFQKFISTDAAETTAEIGERFELDNDENKNGIIVSCEKTLHFLNNVECHP